MEKKQRNKIRSFLIAVAACLLVCCMPVQAATVYTQEQIREAMEQAFDSGDTQVSITTERTFSVNEYERKQEAESYAQELWDILQEVALGKGLLLNGTVYSYRIENSQRVTYQFDISPEFTKEVTVLKSEKSAYKNALKALKNRDYDAIFYSENAMYYETFVLALQHHPEFNYGLVIWKSTDGTCGYRLGNVLSKEEVRSRMVKTNKKVNEIAKKILKSGMTKKQKLAAIHDYLVKNCAYDKGKLNSSYDNAYTAYGCLVEKQAVCQGYAAAFNLLATKAGICSIAVCGDAGGGSHAWNYVKIGSNYRYVDTTWDDPVPDRGSKAKVSRTYYYLTQKKLEKTHTWDKTEHAKKYVDYAAVL